MTLKTGRRSPSQNAYGWRETGMHEENWCHRPWSPIFSHEDGLGKAKAKGYLIVLFYNAKHQQTYSTD